MRPQFALPQPEAPSVAVTASRRRFPVHRIYCVGRGGREIRGPRALEHVFGYAAGNELGEVSRGRIGLSVNGELRQESDVSRMGPVNGSP